MLVLMSLLGCGPSDGAAATPDALLATLPDASLLLSMPTPPTAAVGGPSPMYALAYHRAEQVNDRLAPVLALVEGFAGTQPVQQLDAVSLWRHADGDAQVSLWMEPVGEGGTRWLVARHSDDETFGAVVGAFESTEGGETLRIETGTDGSLPMPDISTSLPPSSREDPLQPVVVEQSVSSETLVVRLEVEAGFVEGLDEARVRFVATTAYDGGTFDTLERQDLVGDAGLELMAVRTRWLASGEGRADGVVCGADCGDVEADTLGTATDCFGDDGLLVYAARSWGETDGEPADCVFDEELPDADFIAQLSDLGAL